MANKVLSLAPITFVDDISILIANTSQSFVLNSLAEQVEKSKKLQFIVTECKQQIYKVTSAFINPKPRNRKKNTLKKISYIYPKEFFFIFRDDQTMK